MLEGVRATAPQVRSWSWGGRPATGLAERVVPDGLRPYAMPGLMSVLFLLGLALSLTRLGLLLEWSERHDGVGEHVVLGCEADGVSGGDVWRCDGALVAEGSTSDVRSELVASRGALASHRPYVGQRTDVFFDPDRLGTAYPVSRRMNELTRLYLSLLPRVLLAGGAAIWLAGWFLTNNLDVNDLLLRDRVRFPGRFVWRSRGTRWLLVAALALVVNVLLTTHVLGTLGTF